MSAGQGEQDGVMMAQAQYRAGKRAQAEATLRRLLNKPDMAMRAAHALATILIEDGRYEPAAFELERAIKKYGEQLPLLLAYQYALQGIGKRDRALDVAMRARELAPQSDEVAGVLGLLYLGQGRLAEAQKWFEEAQRLNPVNLGVATNLVQVYSASLQMPRAIALIRNALQGPLRSLDMLQLLAYRLQFVSGVQQQDVFEAHKIAGTATAGSVDGMPPRLQVSADPDRPLTIGYVSPDFRRHSCAHFIEPLLSGRNRRAFRVIAYSAMAYEDETTRRLKGLVDAWRPVAAIDNVALANQIASDKVDIAFDLSGHTGGTRLAAFALRPAPITMTYIGYPNTTGLPGMDYRIVDSITDPPGAESLATEKLIRLDPCFLCYRPVDGAPNVSEAPCVQEGHVTFGSFNVLDKVSEETLDAWAEVLRATPGARMLIKSRVLGEDQSVVDRVRSAFESRGVDPRRVDLHGWTQDVHGHLSAYSKIDIGLDTFPYNGTTTTCEAMWMGVPVVALRGGAHAGRVGASLASAMGMPDLVADDAAGFVRIASTLAADREKLRTIRGGLRAVMQASPLCDVQGFVARFESTLREIWRGWCRGQAR